KSDELFAIITYKNLDPKDFVLLNKREGKLYSLINNKNKYIKEIIEKIDLEIQNIETEIRNIESHSLFDLEELKYVYLQKILSQLPSNAVIDKTVYNGDLDNLINSHTISYRYIDEYNRVYHKNFSFDFSLVEKEVNPDFT